MNKLGNNIAAKPKHEIAEILQIYGPAFRKHNRLTYQQHKVMNDIERCRTAVLGGHVDECDVCGHKEISYNSCRNRHCPKCQGEAIEKWVEAQEAKLLPIEYFHVVFTLPDGLNDLIRYNRRMMYDLFFKAASQTLLEFGQSHLGGVIGFTAILHTWSQTLMEHYHLHCIVTGGALKKNGQEFKKCYGGYLFPVRSLSLVFRGKFCNLLHEAYKKGELKGISSDNVLDSLKDLNGLLNGLYKHKWVVYVKRPFAGPEEVIEYIGRYTHKTAITNYRIVSVGENDVSFQWKDYRNGSMKKVMTIKAEEFIRRFLLHVLPKDFVKIRHYGFLSNGQSRKLGRCRALLEGEGVVAKPQDDKSDILELPVSTNQGLMRCERCGVGHMVRKSEISRYAIYYSRGAIRDKGLLPFLAMSA